MPKNKNPGLPPGSNKVPIIGDLTDKDKRLIDTAVQGMIKQIEPPLSGMGQMLDAMDKRVQIVEELVNATLVDILAKKVGEKLNICEPHVAITPAQAVDEMVDEANEVLRKEKK